MVRNPLDVGGSGYDDEKGEVPGEHAGEELEMEDREPKIDFLGIGEIEDDLPDLI